MKFKWDWLQFKITPSQNLVIINNVYFNTLVICLALFETESLYPFTEALSMHLALMWIAADRFRLFKQMFLLMPIFVSLRQHSYAFWPPPTKLVLIQVHLYACDHLMVTLTMPCQYVLKDRPALHWMMQCPH